MLDKAPSALQSLVKNMTKTQLTQAIEPRRQWLTKAVHADAKDISLSEMADMSRVNSELSQLCNVQLSDDANETLKRLDNLQLTIRGFMVIRALQIPMVAFCVKVIGQTRL